MKNHQKVGSYLDNGPNYLHSLVHYPKEIKTRYTCLSRTLSRNCQSYHQSGRCQNYSTRWYSYYYQYWYWLESIFSIIGRCCYWIRYVCSLIVFYINYFQIRGKKRWILKPPPECYWTCNYGREISATALDKYILNYRLNFPLIFFHIYSDCQSE